MRFAFSLRENIDEKTSSCKQKNERRPADPRPCAGCHLTEMGNQGIMRKRVAFSNPDIGRAQGHRPYVSILASYRLPLPSSLFVLFVLFVAKLPSPVSPVKGRGGLTTDN